MTLAQTQYKTNRDEDLEENLICVLDLPASFKGIGNEFLIYLYAWDSLLQTFIFGDCYFLNAQ